jgi:type I restriction enzyme S subunit
MKTGWRTEPLGELCEFQRGLTYAKGDEVEVSANVVLRATNIDLATNLLDCAELKYINDNVAIPDCKKMKKGSLLLCTASGSKSHLGKVAYIDDDYDYAFGGFMGMITPKHDLVPRYLFYLMTSDAYRDFIGELSDGVNINNLRFDDLNTFPVSYPARPEQLRIVAILDEAFEGIATAKANAEKNLHNARAIFESHLQAVFALNTKRWVASRKRLSDLCELIVDCEHRTAPIQQEGLPSIRTPNIGKGELLLDNVYRVSEATYREWTRRAEPLPGDLILAREAPAGNVAVIPKHLRVCLGQRTVLIRPDRGVFEPEFLAMLLLRPQIQGRLLAHSRGATVEHVNMKDIRALDVGAIPPLDVQRTIVSGVAKASHECKRLESVYSQKLGSSAEPVGGFGRRQVAERVVQGDF